MSSHQSVGTKQKAAAATAGALGARTARACDGCLKWRARWYCAADDAFLCQPCDSSVHSANPVARRHHRVRIKVASSSSSSPSSSPSVTPSSPLSLGASEDDEEPAWIHGFKRKARTPRGKPGAAAKAEPLVPDLESLSDDDDQQQQLLYRVPVFDPVLAEFCSPPPAPLDDEYPSAQEDTKPMVQTMSLDCKAAPGGLGVCALADADCLAGLHPSDMDLEEFAADMESLLGQNLDDDAFCIDALALMESDVLEADMNAIDKRKVKMEAVALDVACCGLDVEFDISKEALDLEPGYMSPTATGPIEEEHKAVPGATVALTGIKSKRILRLDYEAVIAAWSSNGSSPSPWTGGERPQFCLDDRWPESPGTWLGRGGDVQGALYGSAGLHAAMGGGDGGGREAKVTRYREKRRTRLFSKKIRYEVRKLNAEKRPRMKGRFVKRSPPPPSVAGIAAVPYVY